MTAKMTIRLKVFGFALAAAMAAAGGCEYFRPPPQPKTKPAKPKRAPKAITRPAASKPTTATAPATAPKPPPKPEPWTKIRKISPEQSFKVFARLHKGAALRVPLLAEPAVVDGVLDDAYSKATPIKLSFQDGREDKPTALTTVHVISTRNELFVFFRCESPDMSVLRATVEERDGPVWNDDCVELYIDPTNRRAADSYVQICINPLGTRADLSRPKGRSDPSWNPKLVVAAKINEKDWTAEISLPFAQLVENPRLFDRVWAVNFNRIARLAEGHEDTAWSPTGKRSSHVPERFGRLWLEAGKIYTNYAHWTGPRHVYSPPPRRLFRAAETTTEAMAKCTDLTPNPSKTYWFGRIMLPNNSEALIVLTDDRAVRITSLHGWRPISAKWMNDKLLHVWRTTRDEAGYYGIYDVERGKIVHEELESQGLELWEKISGKKRPKRKLPRL